MTYREFYTAIVNGEITEEVVAKATEEIAKLDERNAKRAAAPKRPTPENAALMGRIAEFMADGGTHLAKEIGEALEISTSKASGLCGQMVKNGTLTASEVKIPKIGKRVGYTLA